MRRSVRDWCLCPGVGHYGHVACIGSRLNKGTKDTQRVGQLCKCGLFRESDNHEHVACTGSRVIMDKWIAQVVGGARIKVVCTRGLG